MLKQGGFWEDVLRKGLLQTVLEVWLYGAEQGCGGSAERPALLLTSHQDRSGLVGFVQ